MRKIEEKKDDRVWDKKKITILVLSFLVILFALLYIKASFFPSKKIEVEGASTYKYTQSPEVSQASEKFQENLDKLKENAQNLNMVDVATSSPQVQKVINDLKSLQDLPRSQAKQTCEKICAGL